MVHVVTYDLKSPNDKSEDYSRVIGGIKSSYPTYAHVEGSVWFVSTSSDTSAVRDKVKTFLSKGDVLLVVQVQDWATSRVSEKVTDWLKARTF